MIPFHVITGFLGSGKTTLLQHILHQLGNSKKVAVIQNEFAPSGVDGKILSHENDNFHLTEINNGSVFCVCQLNNFVQTVQKLVSNYKPDVIFLESSGMADPISVAELLQTPELDNMIRLGGIFTLADAFNFEKGLSTLTRFKHQLMVADKIVLNKIDLVENDLKGVEDKIRELNPFAPIEKTQYAKVNWNTFELDIAEKGKAAHRFKGKESEGRPEHTKALVLRAHQKITEESLNAMITQLQKDCIRIKGFVNVDSGKVAAIQSVFSNLDVEWVEGYVGPTEIIVFSERLQINDLRKLYKRFTQH